MQNRLMQEMGMYVNYAPEQFQAEILNMGES